MKLVVGLGNPGRKYVGTRHNIGFEVISELARRHASGQRPKAKFDGEWVETYYKDQKLCLLCPLTFMNLSGNCVRPVVDFFKIETDDVLVICDDLNLPVGRLRFRPSGSAGGQNGLDDIIRRMGTQQISRLRIGIGKPPPQWDVSGYVLGKFESDDLEEIGKAIKRAADGVETWLQSGISRAMNQFNGSAEAPASQTKQKKPVEDAKAPTETPTGAPATGKDIKQKKESEIQTDD